MRPQPHLILNRNEVHRLAAEHLQQHLNFKDYKRKTSALVLWSLVTIGLYAWAAGWPRPPLLLFLALAPSFWWLFVGRAIAGMTGASGAVASAYIADITPAEHLTRVFELAAEAGALIDPDLAVTPMTAFMKEHA